MPSEKKEYPVKPEIKEVKANETFEKELFTIISKDGEFLIALGNQVVSRGIFTNREAAEAYIDSKPWELILNSCAYMWQKLSEIDKKEQ